MLGLVNGFGVAYLRIPSMIVTLAINAVAQGLMVVHTGGFSPQDSASPAMRVSPPATWLFGLPNALIVWALVGGGAMFLLTRTDLRPRRLRDRQPRARGLSFRASTRSAS